MDVLTGEMPFQDLSPFSVLARCLYFPLESVGAVHRFGMKWPFLRADRPDSLRPQGLQPARLLCPCDCPGKNTAVGGRALLQGIVPTQGSNPRLLHWQVASLPLSRRGRPGNASLLGSKVQQCALACPRGGGLPGFQGVHASLCRLLRYVVRFALRSVVTLELTFHVVCRRRLIPFSSQTSGFLICWSPLS